MAKFEVRLYNLEQMLGFDSPLAVESSGSAAQNNDLTQISSRVQTLLDKTKLRLQSNNNAAQPSSSNILEEDLDGLINLNNLEQSIFLASAVSNDINSNNSKPLVYRKHELLARSEELQNALEEIATIRDLLCVSNPKLTKELQHSNTAIFPKQKQQQLSRSQKRISIESVTNAPIIISPPYMFAEQRDNQDKLKELSERIERINDRVVNVTAKCDAVIGTYYNLISAVNEKLILRQEVE